MKKVKRNNPALKMLLLIVGVVLASTTLSAQRGFRGDGGNHRSHRATPTTTPRVSHASQGNHRHRGNHAEPQRYKVVYETVGGYYRSEHKMVWQAGHWDTVNKRVYVPGRYEERVTYERHRGHYDKVIHKVWIEGCYEVKQVRVWHAGEYVRKEVKVWVPKRRVAKRVPIRRHR